MKCEEIDLEKFRQHLNTCSRCGKRCSAITLWEDLEFIIIVTITLVFFLAGFIDFPKGCKW